MFPGSSEERIWMSDRVVKFEDTLTFKLFQYNIDILFALN